MIPERRFRNGEGVEPLDDVRFWHPSQIFGIDKWRTIHDETYNHDTEYESLIGAVGTFIGTNLFLNVYIEDSEKEPFLHNIKRIGTQTIAVLQPTILIFKYNRDTSIDEYPEVLHFVWSDGGLANKDNDGMV